MKLKTYMLFSPERAEIVWQDEAPLWYEGIKIGKIEKVDWNKDCLKAIQDFLQQLMDERQTKSSPFDTNESLLGGW